VDTEPRSQGSLELIPLPTIVFNHLAEILEITSPVHLPGALGCWSTRERCPASPPARRRPVIGYQRYFSSNDKGLLARLVRSRAQINRRYAFLNQVVEGN
jgi:hypothetical protein